MSRSASSRQSVTVGSGSDSDSDDAILQLAQKPRASESDEHLQGEPDPDKRSDKDGKKLKHMKKNSQPRRRYELAESYTAFRLGVLKLYSQKEMHYEAQSDDTHSEPSDSETDGSDSGKDCDGPKPAKRSAIGQFVKSARIIHPDGTVKKCKR